MSVTPVGRFCLLAALPFCTGSVAASSLPQTPTLDQLVDVPLAVASARFDYVSIDASRHLLFIAHLGASQVLAFDLRSRALVAKVGGLDHVHGVLAVPELGRVYATATGSDEVVTLDADTLAVTTRVAVGDHPDGLAYAPAARRIFVSNKRGASESVIDVDSGRVVATIALGGEVGNTQFDPGTGRIFVNVQGTHELVEIDPERNTIVARHPLPGAKGNHGLLIDGQPRLAFIACEDNDELLVFDLGTRTVRERFPLAEDPDVLALDAPLRLLYVASESGGVSMFRIDGRRVVALARVEMGPNAHVVAVDPATHEVYFPLRDVGGRPVLRIARPSINGDGGR